MNKKQILEEIKESQAKLIILTILTGGIYFVLQLYKNQDKYNALNDGDNKVIPDWIFYVFFATLLITGLCGFGMNNSFDGIITSVNSMNRGGAKRNYETYQALSIISTFVTVLGSILWIITAFKIKSALEDYTRKELNQELGANAFLTFLFTIFYINHKVNQIVSGNLTGVPTSNNNSGTDDISSQLEKLADLKEKGILSQEEFDTKKQELLSKI